MKFLSFTYRKWSLVLLVCLGTFSSCIKETVDFGKISSKTNVSPVLGVPLAEGSLSLKDLIEAADSSGLIKEYPDGLLYLAYRSTLSPGDIKPVTIKDQTFPTETFAQNLFVPSVPGTVSYSINKTYPLSLTNGMEIDSVFLKNGLVAFSIQSTFKFTGAVTITLPSLTKAGIPLTQTVQINTADGTFNVALQTDIKDYKLVASAGGLSNQVPVNMAITLLSGGQPLVGQVSVGVSLKSLEFKSLFGYVGQYEIINKTDVLDLNVFGTDNNVNIEFANPQIRLYSTNSFGASMDIAITNMKTSDNLNVTFPPKFTFTSPPQVGKTAYDTFKIDNTNSTIHTALATNPKSLSYKLAGTINPNGKTPGLKNFVTDSSRLGIDMDVELPMNLKIGKYVLKDTIPFELSKNDGETDPLDYIKELVIQGSFANQMPFEVMLQVVFTDNNYVPKDSLFATANQYILKSGTEDVKGNPIAAKYNVDVKYSDARKKNFETVTKAIIRATVSTSNNGQTFVKIKSGHRLQVNLGANAQIQIKL